MNNIKINKLKDKAIRNIITSEFEIEEGMRISFEEGYEEGIKDLQKEIKKLRKKLDSNWYYCEKKSEYGNIILNFIDEMNGELRKIEKYLNTKNIKRRYKNGNNLK